MKNHIHSHFEYATIMALVLFLSVGVLLFYFFSANPQLQYLLVMTLSFCYFLWGLAFHHVKGDLHLKIMLEYLTIALLAILLLRGAIFH